MMPREYTFYIIDNEFGGSYDFNAFFENAADALQFIRDNLKAGNLIFTESVRFLVPQIINWDHDGSFVEQW